jgi:hypothetical protein
MPETESDPTPLSRIELLRLAQSLGVSDADVMTRAELRAAIAEAKAPAPAPVEQPTTWVGVARRLLASVIERGLNLPDAAALIRGDAKLTTPPKAPPPVATVTLARIYAAQGHLDRAIGTLDEVLKSDPDHELARDLRAQLELRRQESVARDADATPSERPEDELTPIMPEVALREAAERPAATRVDHEDPTTTEATSNPAPDLAPSLQTAPSSEPPGELVAPAFAVAERAEASFAEGATHDSRTPPAPSVFSSTEPESASPSTLVAVEAAAPSSIEPSASDVAPSSETSPSSEPIAPSETGAHPADAAPSGAFASAASVEVPPSEALASEALASEALAGEALAGEVGLALQTPFANGLENGVAHAALAPPAAPIAAAVLPEVPGLVLIEAERRQYLYWELGSSGSAPCWLHVVSHTPAVDGHTERRERRFPVQQRQGALRFEGVPADAVVRAKLSRDPDGKPVAVAGAVRSRETSFEIQFCPHPRAPLEAIARRAEPMLARATPVYWDS